MDVVARRCDLHRLGDEGLWVLHPAEPAAGASLRSLALEITGAAMWAEVPAETPAPPADAARR